MHTLDKNWWKTYKKNYVFNEDWFNAFARIDPALQLPRNPDGSLTRGKIGLVLWHAQDGKTIIPVGITRHDIIPPEDPDGESRFIFCYHPDYVDDPETEAISLSLPKRKEPYVADGDFTSFLPYFDNLVSDGPLGMAQRNACHKLAGKRDDIYDLQTFTKSDTAKERYDRLLTFGRGLHGAISVVDVAAPDDLLKGGDFEASLHSQSTIVGIQNKLPATTHGTGDSRDGFIYKIPAREDDVNLIAKRQSGRNQHGILQNESLALQVTMNLLDEDVTVASNLGIWHPSYEDETALFIRRFDRLPNGGRVHFEEALQALGSCARHKYDHSYRELADVTRKLCGEQVVIKLFKRILTQFLLGNSDGHMKNFAFWKKNGQWDLTPNYDLVSDELYAGENLSLTTPLSIKGRKPDIREIGPKHILDLGEEMGLSPDQIKAAVHEIQTRLPKVIKFLGQAVPKKTRGIFREVFVTPGYLPQSEDRKKLYDVIKRHEEQMFTGFDRCCEIRERETGERQSDMGRG